MSTHLPKFLADTFGVSRSEARRVLSQGGVRVNDEITQDLDADLSEGDTVRIGKRRAIQIVSTDPTEPDEITGVRAVTPLVRDDS